MVACGTEPGTDVVARKWRGGLGSTGEVKSERKTRGIVSRVEAR